MNCEKCDHPQEAHMGGQGHCTQVIDEIMETNPKFFGYVPAEQLPRAFKICHCKAFTLKDDPNLKNGP